MKIINNVLLDNVGEQACANARLRMNFNLHNDTNEPINRLLNAMEPGTYIRPHRHTQPPKDEGIIVLRGEIAVIIFDDGGEVKELTVLNPAKGIYGVDIAANEWHSFIVLQPYTVIYEVKQGPYAPIADCDWAAWSPPPGDTAQVGEYIERMRKMIDAVG